MIRIGIFGYGNLGRGVECAIKQNPDMELVCVFTRRDPEAVKILTDGVAVLRADEVEKMVDKIDVMILCGGSATDLPVQTPYLAKMFNVVDKKLFSLLFAVELNFLCSEGLCRCQRVNTQCCNTALPKI